MKTGDLVEFKYTNVGLQRSISFQWRKGLIVEQRIDNSLFSGKIEYSYIFYKGRIFRALSENCRALGGL